MNWKTLIFITLILPKFIFTQDFGKFLDQFTEKIINESGIVANESSKTIAKDAVKYFLRNAKLLT